MFIPLVWYCLAASAEIGGCYAFWMWLRQSKSPLWIIPGLASLIVFATALTRVDAVNAGQAGRAFAAYGGIYILASIAWLWGVEKVRPDRWDLLGAGLCVVGSLIILFGPRTR